MVASGDVVDISLDPIGERRRRRRQWLRIGLPIAGVLVMIATILVIAFYSARSNEEGALLLSRNLIATLDDRIALEVSTYLDPPAAALRVLKASLGDAPFFEELPRAETLAASLLRELPQIDSFSLADGDGNYALLRRDDGGGTIVKLIRTTPGPRRVEWVHFSAAGAETGRTEDTQDQFDARTRPWFKGALAQTGQYWTGVYMFFTLKEPGITVSERFADATGQPLVFGADITLSALSRFLARLAIAKTGRAVIIDKTGHLIAAPAREGAAGPRPETVDALGDSVMTHAYDRFRVAGAGESRIDVDGRTYVTAAIPLAAPGREWSVLLVAPEDEFVGFLAASNRDALLMSLAIVGVAAAMAALLMRQGLRADRNARLLVDRQAALRRQSAAFSSLAGDASLFDGTGDAAPQALTETLADIADARRASVWRFAGHDRVLRCADSFDRDTRGHVAGLELHRDELPQFFAQLLGGETLDAADAEQDRRTAELYRVMMRPLGTRALFAMPARSGERVLGAIWLEDAPRAAAGRDFVQAAAALIAPRLADVGEGAEPAKERASGRAPLPQDGAPRSFSADLKPIETLAADAHAGVAVMVLRLADEAAAAGPLPDALACALQEVAAQHDIPYLKILGQEMIAAAGFAGAANGAAAVIADAAIALRARCHELAETGDPAQGFAIGIDCGIAVASAVGSNPRVFNLWGDAVRTAQHMAASAPAGAVQVTEAAYERLRHDFLFRRRGSFYLPRVGEAQTFVLAGRL